MKPVTHEIEITVKGNQVLPTANIPKLKVGDTVDYVFKGKGSLSIVFPGSSPYRDDAVPGTEVTSGKVLTVKQAGKFHSGCRLKRSDGTFIGWDPRDQKGTKESGGDHQVEPN